MILTSSTFHLVLLRFDLLRQLSYPGLKPDSFVLRIGDVGRSDFGSLSNRTQGLGVQLEPSTTARKHE
jgi:hypothetical protein